MKYGLLYYKDTDNIGDDIQSYAASQFLPKIDYLVDRENLELFVPKKKEMVKVIMNAWYIHDKFNFDISPYIYPLHISMFMKKFPYDAGITVGIDYINQNVKDNLITYGPVGTRDLHTKKVMDKLGIDNYFSGCMTLTLKKFENVCKGDYIVTVGLLDDEIEYIKQHTNREVIKFQQDVKKGSYSNESWETRKKRVEDTLKLYQGAHMVVTTKLHCSLPCLALETPVLLLYDSSFPENKDRIGTYISYLNHVDRDKFKSSNIDFEKPKKNSNKYLELRKSLEQKCLEFINKPVNDNKHLLSISDYNLVVKRSRVMREIPIKNLELLQAKYEEECKKSAIKKDEMDELKYKYDELMEKYNVLNYRYNRIVNSRIYKMFRKVKKIVRR